MDFSQDPKQWEAIQRACNLKEKTVAITGEAGTGKTSLMKKIYEELTQAGYSVIMTAPTGKAARRVTEATGYKAVTNHKLLEYSHPGERHPVTGKVMGVSQPKRDKYNPLNFDVVLADEYAMVNHELHRNIFDALKRGSVVRVFGDINQLRPIEPSESLRRQDTPFQTLLKRFQGIKLENNYRTGEGSGVTENAHKILQGLAPRANDDFEIAFTNRTTDTLKNYILENFGEMDFSSIDHQIIIPTKKGNTGTYKMNNLIQSLYFGDVDPKLFMNVPRHTWIKEPMKITVGDKVVNTQNIYATEESPLEMFNGETGVVKEFDEYEGWIILDLGDRIVEIPPVISYIDAKGNLKHFDPRKELELAYALTTHKVQGSEYLSVVYVMNRAQPVVLHNRPNFYTGVTRARKKVKVITDTTSFTRSINNKGIRY